MPNSLTGQLIGFMLLALVLSQGISFLIYWDERGHALREVLKEEFLVRSASVARLLESSPRVYHAGILQAVGTNYTRFWLTDENPDDIVTWQQEAWRRLKQPLPAGPAQEVAPPQPDTMAGRDEGARSGSGIVGRPAIAAEAASWSALSPAAWALHRPARYVRLDDTYGSGLTVRLSNGQWLNVAFAKPTGGSAWLSQSSVSLAITAILLSLIAVLAARRIARPLRRLAYAAEAFGRGEETVHLPEEGPSDVRRTAEAFNRMQDRLRRFVADRTSMLAAIGHDLRTPITSLRLRAEFVADKEMRDKILTTLDEMQMITEATLAFAREDAVGETTRLVDLAALAESLCSDLADLDWDVTFVECERTPYRCRPAALRRALRNLIENAVRYGAAASVAVQPSQEWLEIIVDDNGPGIPDAQLEQVFAPFARLESSRSRATGGVGLGLSIARTMARSHGGDIVLVNRQAGGLRAVIRLPRDRVPLDRPQ
ncbi:ATP-binding protein [Pelagibius sp. 7325]|uniref:ATP-binding protein n=1 Tax=Pelagibius sp. 7325 TaxID=3131994 RepID=UPI0030EB1568